MTELPIHPFIVHFPIALVFFSGVLFLLALILKKKDLENAGFFALIGGVATTVGAIISGNMAESDMVHTHEMHEMVELHETLGFVVVWLFGLLLVWSIFRKKAWKGIEKIGFVVVMWVGIGVTLFSGHIGGELVFEKGAGVIPMEETILEEKKAEQDSLKSGAHESDEHEEHDDD